MHMLMHMLMRNMMPILEQSANQQHQQLRVMMWARIHLPLVV